MPRDNFSIKITGIRELQRSLDRFARETERRFSQPVRVPVQFEADDDGYLDRACPAEECRAAFKVLWKDFEDLVREDAAHCVLCGHGAERQDFHTPDQVEYLKRVALGYVTRQLTESARLARLNFRPNSRMAALPPAATEALLQRTTCSSCGCRYASLGSSYFCHSCGHHAAVETFDATMRTVRHTLEVALHGDLGDDRDAAADTRGFMIEGAFERALHAYEAYAGQRYRDLAPDRRKPRKNAFQNLDASNDLWRPVLGRDYSDILTDAEYKDLNRLIQQRHLGHIGGLVDQEYIDKTGDRTYRVGQRLTIRVTAVERLVKIVEKLVSELRVAVRDTSGDTDARQRRVTQWDTERRRSRRARPKADAE